MKKVLIGISVGLNVLVMAILVWALAAPMSIVQLLFGDFIATSHERWVSQFEELAISEGDIVFLGDSITEGGSWHELFPGLPVINRGIGGDTTSGVLARLDQVLTASPSKIFLKIGTNDLFIGIEQANIVANIDEIIRRVKEASPTTEFYLQSVLPRDVGMKEQVEALNAELEMLAGESGVTWVNLYPLFLDDDGSIRDSLANDELHLMGAGYVIWRDHIRLLVE